MSRRPVRSGVTARLAENAKQGSAEDLAALCERIQARLDRFCRHLTGGDRARAQDLAQDAYVKVLEHIQSIPDTSNFSGWLFRVTRNLFLDYVRSAHVTKRSDGEHHLERENGAGSALVRPQVERKLAQISAEDRMVLLLVCLEGHSYAEAAEVSGLTEESVRSRLYRVRKLFTTQEFTELNRG